MVTDQQVRRLWMFIKKEESKTLACHKAGMDEKTGRKYLKIGRLPSEIKARHSWRTRTDPFEEAWSEVCELLETNPGLEAKTIFEYLQRKTNGQFQEGQLRTLQRRIKQWRATEGPAKEVFFTQEYRPGELSESNFTHANELNITIDGEPFKHLLYHYVLVYSNWETTTTCFSESFESLSAGYQNAVWELGGVTKRHRTDRMSAAVHQDCNPERFTQIYKALLRHYSVEPERTNPASGNENGDVEQRHYRLKNALKQALMLRGSCDFNSRADYEAFLRVEIDRLNATRKIRVQEELAVLSRLPARRLDDYKPVDVTVSPSSTVSVLHNTYSVHSRLIGERVRVRVYTSHLEIWYGQRVVERIPRIRGENKHRINYRHIIYWLVRKPGAFENYRYKEEMFPSSNFRIVYDCLKRQNALTANKEYVAILYLAAREGESITEAAVRRLLSQGLAVSAQAIKDVIMHDGRLPAVTDVFIQDVALSSYDELLTAGVEEERHG